jgi:hypothetical protein
MRGLNIEVHRRIATITTKSIPGRESKIMEKIGRVIQGGTTINFSCCQENQQTTSPIRNIVGSVHVAEHLA